MSDDTNDTARDPRAEIAQLRAQVQKLMDERVSPALSQAADTARHYAHDAREMYGDQAEALSERVREAPIMAMLIAVGAGYILGRIAR